MRCKSWHHRFLVVLADVCRNPTKERFAVCCLRHLLNIACHQQHSVAAIAVEPTVTILALRCAAVNDSNEVIVYDYSVLAFLLGVLGDDALFYYLHAVSCNVDKVAG